MRIIISTFILIAIVAGCRQNNRKAESNIAEITADTTVVNVLYFRVKQRCETCIAVAAVARKTVETVYSDNDKVRYMEIDNSDKANEALLEKYEVAWNALIIVKGDDAVDITQHAFFTAVSNPQKLENLIINEINKRLKDCLKFVF